MISASDYAMKHHMLPDTVSCSDYKGVAFSVLGWTGEDFGSGDVICVMIGDDRLFHFDIDDLQVLDDSEFCHSCGQVGCGHDSWDD